MIEIGIIIGCIISIFCYFVFGFLITTFFIDEKEDNKRTDLFYILGVVSVVEVIFLGLLMGYYYV